MSETIQAMVARIDERTKAIFEQLDDGKKRMDAIEKRLGIMPCQERGEKIKTIERITWGSAGLVLAMLIKSAWSMLTGGQGG